MRGPGRWGVIVAAAGCMAASTQGARGQAIQGMVWDDATGRPLAGATVRVLTPNLDPVTSATADATGRYEVVLDSAGTYVVAASFGGYAAAAPEVIDVGAERVSLMLALRPLTSSGVDVTTRASTELEGRLVYVYGQVLQGNSSKPVEDARVYLRGRDVSVLTGWNGRFFLRDVEPGLLDVAVEHIAYEDQEREFPAEAGQAYELIVRLEQEAIPVEGFEVTARSQHAARILEPVFRRMDMDLGGHFLTRSDFEMRGHVPVAEMLRGLPSVTVRKGLGPNYMITSRRAWTLDGPCEFAVYLDGRRVFRPGDPPTDLLTLSTIDVEAIEIFPGAASLPPEYNDPGTLCAIGIWTRRGG